MGYSARLNKDTVQMLLEDPLVKWVERDQYVSINEKDTQEEQIQVDPGAWGLRRVAQNPEFVFAQDNYTFWQSAGNQVDVYIIDTGIYVEHVDFGGRARIGYNAIPSETPNDCNGHGTHVASTAAGLEYGIAKRANLIAVKVLGCSGSGQWTGVIDGIDWTTRNYNQNKPATAVANMSLGGGVTPTVDAAVTNSIAAGVSYAIAGGNSNADACTSSPARVPTAVTVGASFYQIQNGNPAAPAVEIRASFSNWGTCTTLFAPGQNIKAAWITNPTSTNTISGTSMASPHAAGVIAVRLGHLVHEEEHSGRTPAEIKKFLIENAIPNRISNPGTGTPNLILFSPYEDDKL